MMDLIDSGKEMVTLIELNSEYELVSSKDDIKEKLKRFISENNTIYDTTDIADYIFDYKDGILNIIKD